MESAVLVSLLYLVHSFPVGGLAGAVLLLVLQAATTFLIHCPAHYLVGGVLGIRFNRISLGPSTITNALPPSLRGLGRVVPVFRLSVNKETSRAASPGRLKAMYLSGVTASAGSSAVIAVAVTLTGTVLASTLTWSFALLYLFSDVFLSPKGGDVMRARMASERRAKPSQ